MLPEMQARNSNQRKTTENHNTQRARRTDAEPINRAISRDLLARLCKYITRHNYLLNGGLKYQAAVCDDLQNHTRRYLWEVRRVVFIFCSPT